MLDINSTTPAPNNECPAFAITQKIGYILIGVNVFASALGTFGNLLVCIAVFTTVNMTSSFHYFITSLAMADLLICGVDQPLLAVLLHGRIYSRCMNEVCFAFRLVGNFACSISLLMLGLISLDRCLFVTRTLGYKNTMTKGKFATLTVVWLLAFAYSGLRMAINKKVTSYLTVAVFGLCYLAIIISYIFIYLTVSKHRRLLVSQERGSSEERTNLAKQQAADKKERRFAHTIILVVLVFSASWGLLFYQRMTHPKEDYGVLYNIGRTIALSSSACNPLLYCFMNSEYRKAFKRILLKAFSSVGLVPVKKGYERVK